MAKPMACMMPTLRERLAARHIVIPDRKAVRRARASLSKAWHRDARRIGRKAMAMEHRGEASMHGWFARLVPRVVQVEHRMEGTWRHLAARLRA